MESRSDWLANPSRRVSPGSIPSVGGAKPTASSSVFRIWVLVRRQARGFARVIAEHMPTSTLGGVTGGRFDGPPVEGELPGPLPSLIWPVHPRQASATAADSRDSFICSSGRRSGPDGVRYYSDTARPPCVVLSPAPEPGPPKYRDLRFCVE